MARRSKDAKPQLSFIFTPQGFVCDVRRDEGGAPQLAEESQAWLDRFEGDRASALFDLGFASPEPWFSPSMRFLHRVSDAFVRFTLQQPDIELLRENAEPAADEADKAALLLALPFSPGSEFVDAAWLDGVFGQLLAIYRTEIAEWPGTVEQYVAERTQNLRVPGRIFFHLVENARDAEDGFPFAFVATYASADEKDGAIRHFPLRYALGEYEEDPRKLLSLIAGLSSAAQESAFLSQFMESGELFHPLRLTSDEAYAFLKDVPLFEDAGILCRVPNWWKRGAASAKVNVRIGEDRPAGLGAEALVQLSPSFTVDGVELTHAEIEELLAQTEGLAFLKGKTICPAPSGGLNDTTP